MIEEVVYPISMVVHLRESPADRPLCGTRARGWVLVRVADTADPEWWAEEPMCVRCERIALTWD